MEWAEENQANSHSGEDYVVSCFCLTLIPPGLLSNRNWKLFPRRNCAMGTMGTVHFHAVKISDVFGAINQFFHISL
jgi:hypothetical protein